MDNYTLANSSIQEEINDESEISDWTRYVLIGFMALVALIGIPGNVIVIAVQSKLRSKSSTDYFVSTIAVFDLFSAAINTTCYILRYQTSVWMLLASVELCRLHNFSLYTTNIASTLLLTAIAFDRHRRTISRLPADSPSVVTKTKRICACIVVFSLVFGVVSSLVTTLESATKTCRSTEGYAILRNILRGMLAVSFAVLLVVVVYCYTRISIILHHHHRMRSEMQLHTQKGKYRNNKGRGKISKAQPLSDSDSIPSTSKDLPVSPNTGKGHLYNSFRSEIALKKEALVFFSKESKEIGLKVHDKCNADEMKSKGNQSNKSKEDAVVSQNAMPHARKNKGSSNMPQHKRASNATVKNKNSRKGMNRMNLMMFLITLVYFGTWIGNWTTFVYKAIVGLPLPGADLAGRVFMINAITNPVFYMVMSSKFREKATELFC